MIDSLNKRISLLKAREEILRSNLKEQESRKEFYLKRHGSALKARILLQEIATITQKKVEERISGIVSLALEAVFQDPYKFVLEFVPKRNQTECILHFEKNNERVKPIAAAGGGTVDVAAFALRIAFLSIDRKSRRVLICDEPFRFVSRNYLPRINKIMQVLSDKYAIQFIIVTHIKELIDSADKVFEL